MIKENIVVGEGTSYPLNGILTLPENVGKTVPAVVFVHGSGSSNMDEKVGKLTPFKDLAEGLAKHGIASIRYDKRSFAHGFKLIKEKAPWCKVVVGGAVLNQEYSDMIGADKYAKDAMETVRYAEEIIAR